MACERTHVDDTSYRRLVVKEKKHGSGALIKSGQKLLGSTICDLLPLVPCHSLSGLCEQALELVLH